MNETVAKGLYKDEDITIIDQEGKILLNRLPNGITNPDELGKNLAKIGSEILTDVESALSRAHLKSIESILVQGDNGKFNVLSSEKGKFYLITVGNIQ